MSRIRFSLLALLLIGFFSWGNEVFAATLSISPNTGVYTVGKPFTVNVMVTTDGKPINAADGQISFNPRELSVVSASRASSIFNLWTEEPTFSNSAGTISFGGGSPTGYKGTSGTVISVTFSPLSAGAPKVSFKSGSVLAADGMGTNVLTSMNGGTFTVSAATANPEPEYIAPANTPKAPVITSSTHGDQTKWYAEKDAKLSWKIPAGITAVRTLLDDAPNTIPTIVYDEALTEKTIKDLSEGVSYFHIQLKNADGWGKVAHYKLSVDTEAPTEFSITEGEPTPDGAQVLVFSVTDVSPILEYKIQIDGGETTAFVDEKASKRYTLPTLQPGSHTIVVEAVDSAGHNTVATYALTIEAFEKPVFTEFPERINTEVIPAIKGTTRPNTSVAVEVRKAGDGVIFSTMSDKDGDPYTILSNAEGVFTFVPNQPFERGVYTISATARDSAGKISETSDEIKIIVETPGYIVFGGAIISVLSVIVPLLALVLLMIFGSWYLWHKLSLWRKKVRTETIEAEDSLAQEFTSIVENLHIKVEALKVSRKNKLTKAELALIEQIEADLTGARIRIAKEINDIEESIQ